jgi:MraZ protein
MLLGEYCLTLDEEGRFSLPAHVRETLHDMYGSAALVITDFFEGCLTIYPEEEWQRLQMRSAVTCAIDFQGRVFVPPEFRQYAGIEREVFLIGMVKCLELWAPHRWGGFEAEPPAGGYRK